MSICHACGGVIGRDCWNPQECAEITSQIQMEQTLAGPTGSGAYTAEGKDARDEQISSLQAIVEGLTKERDEALREATNLATWMHRNYYSDVTQWRPLNDPAGVISQIDNMVAGLRDRLQAAEAQVGKLTEALRELRLIRGVAQELVGGDWRIVLASIDIERTDAVIARALSSSLLAGGEGKQGLSSSRDHDHTSDIALEGGEP